MLSRAMLQLADANVGGMDCARGRTRRCDRDGFNPRFIDSVANEATYSE